jgi:hypothetical protein
MSVPPRAEPVSSKPTPFYVDPAWLGGDGASLAPRPAPPGDHAEHLRPNDRLRSLPDGTGIDESLVAAERGSEAVPLATT